jgi:hypothetical protein
MLNCKFFVICNPLPYPILEKTNGFLFYYFKALAGYINKQKSPGKLIPELKQ